MTPYKERVHYTLLDLNEQLALRPKAKYLLMDVLSYGVRLWAVDDVVYDAQVVEGRYSGKVVASLPQHADWRVVALSAGELVTNEESKKQQEDDAAGAKELWGDESKVVTGVTESVQAGMYL